jgi:hypothetical protein
MAGFHIARMTFISLKSSVHNSGQPYHGKPTIILGVGHVAHAVASFCQNFESSQMSEVHECRGRAVNISQHMP